MLFQQLLFLQTTILLIIFLNIFLFINAFSFKLLKETAKISQSGPTIFKENNYIVKDKKEDFTQINKRAAYFDPRNNDFNNTAQNNNWGDLLISSEPPNEYLKLWLLSEHNRYRQMV